jgi:hypothetical protein
LEHVNKGLGCLTLAMCAACPALCISVISAVIPEQMAEGFARDVKFAVEDSVL